MATNGVNNVASQIAANLSADNLKNMKSEDFKNTIFQFKQAVNEDVDANVDVSDGIDRKEKALLNKWATFIDKMLGDIPCRIVDFCKDSVNEMLKLHASLLSKAQESFKQGISTRFVNGYTVFLYPQESEPDATDSKTDIAKTWTEEQRNEKLGVYEKYNKIVKHAADYPDEAGMCAIQLMKLVQRYGCHAVRLKENDKDIYLTEKQTYAILDKIDELHKQSKKSLEEARAAYLDSKSTIRTYLDGMSPKEREAYLNYLLKKNHESLDEMHQGNLNVARGRG